MAFSADKYTVENLQRIKNSYEIKYRPFYHGLQQLYPDSSVGLGKNIAIVSRSIENAIETIDRVLAHKANATEIHSLVTIVETVNSMHSSIVQISETNAALRSEIGQLAKFVGMSKTDLKSIRKGSKQKVKSDVSLTKDLRNLVGDVKEYGFLRTVLESGLGWYGAGTVKRGVRGALDIVGSALGPFQPLMPATGIAAGTGYAAYKLGWPILKWAGSRAFDAQVGLAKLALSPFLKGKKKKDDFSPFTAGAAPISPINTIQPSTIMPQMMPGGTLDKTPFRLLSRRKKEAATEPLFYFFNKRAYKAGWTRDVLKELRRISGGKDKSNSLWKWVVAGAAAVGAAVWGAKKIKEQIWDKLEDKLFPGQFRKHLGFWQAQKEGALAMWDGVKAYAKVTSWLAKTVIKHNPWIVGSKALNALFSGAIKEKDEMERGFTPLGGAAQDITMPSGSSDVGRGAPTLKSTTKETFGTGLGTGVTNFGFPTDEYKTEPRKSDEELDKTMKKMNELLENQIKAPTTVPELPPSPVSGQSDNEDPALTMLSMFGKIGNSTSADYGWA